MRKTSDKAAVNRKGGRPSMKGSSQKRSSNVLSLRQAATRAWSTATHNVPPLKDWSTALKLYMCSVYKNNVRTPLARVVAGFQREGAI